MRHFALLVIIFCFTICSSFPTSKRYTKHKAPYYEDDEDSDSRAISSNVDLDAVDGAAYERIRNALHSIHARIGVLGQRM
ncbi:hypothetical protein KIN20_008085 [Parelaphostrongylus tenuis]|uniref:Uncharacterized protein n=1 Tax=Parelaphostrongylus tenuis TaxID=148309 RepID=A0AAD5QKF4_PARTN|nr:hypothetical protein KIN20_008085 [Parelaphostrongylus tenuis]